MSDEKRIFLSPPHMSGNELKYIQRAFTTNWIAPLGPNVDEFENILAKYCGVKSVAALSSGTAAIHLALILLGVSSGDEVLASTFTFSATVNPIVYQNAIPVFIDSEPDTWNMDPELLEIAIKERLRKKRGKRIKAIIIAHLYGMPAKMDQIMSIANSYDIPVIEDAAEALGSRYKDRHMGSFGKFGILSFNGNKIITTSGGGALISDDKVLIEKARFLSTQARDKAIHYEHSEIGYNYRLSNVLAGIGCGQMEALEEMISRRRQLFLTYKEELEKIDGITLLAEPDECFISNHWLTTILMDSKTTGLSPEKLISEMEKRNVEIRPLWKPMHLQPVFSSCKGYLNGTSESCFNTGVCLPSGSNLSDLDQERVLEIVLSSITKYSKI